MSANYGLKISKKGVNVKGALTPSTKRFFQMISTDGCLLKKETSSSSSNSNRFFGYILTPDSDNYDFFGSLLEIEIADGGSGYSLYNGVDVVGGDSNARVWINGVDGSGKVTSCYIGLRGSGYEVEDNVATTGGNGTGFTINILDVTAEESSRARPLNYGQGLAKYIIFENPME